MRKGGGGCEEERRRRWTEDKENSSSLCYYMCGLWLLLVAAHHAHTAFLLVRSFSTTSCFQAHCLLFVEHNLMPCVCSDQTIYFLLMQEFSHTLQRHPLQPAILLMYIYVCHSCPWPCISNYHKRPIFLKSLNSKSFHLHFWPLTERLPVGREETSSLRGNQLSLMQTKCPAKRSLR